VLHQLAVALAAATVVLVLFKLLKNAFRLHVFIYTWSVSGVLPVLDLLRVASKTILKHPDIMQQADFVCQEFQQNRSVTRFCEFVFFAFKKLQGYSGTVFIIRNTELVQNHFKSDIPEPCKRS
jgi:hypothetical protein